MAYSSYRSSRYDSLSPPPRYRSLSRSRSQSPARDYSDDESAYNPGNNLYITGLSSRASQRDLEDHFSSEGKVLECHLVVDPRTKESRGFGFVTMDSLESAERCIRHLNKSVLEGRVISVEKAKRKRARTPTPGKYLGVRTSGGSSSYDYERGRGYDGRRSPKYSPYRTSRDYSPDYSPYRGGNRYRDRSPYASGSRYRDRSRSPRYSPYRYGSRYRDRSPSPQYSSYRSNSRFMAFWLCGVALPPAFPTKDVELGWFSVLAIGCASLVYLPSSRHLAVRFLELAQPSVSSVPPTCGLAIVTGVQTMRGIGDEQASMENNSNAQGDTLKAAKFKDILDQQEFCIDAGTTGNVLHQP
ncbi:hypothetical protein L7F22_048810 [Adiantum nelumboides]|nr:hypothetical protein [Adiantum nelumboides]